MPTISIPDATFKSTFSEDGNTFSGDGGDANAGADETINIAYDIGGSPE